MLEIYSEAVRDLLNSKADKRQGLAVREDTKNGFYGIRNFSNFYFLISAIIELFNSTRSQKTIGCQL
jgi:hypothetical protein